MRLIRESHFPLLLGVLMAILAVSVTMVVASSTAAQESAPNLIAVNDLSNIVHPMEMGITSVGAGGPGQTSLVVTLNATNYIGTNTNYTSAIVTLKSLELSVNYQYEASSGNLKNSSTTVTLTPSLIMLTDQQKTLAVNVGSLPSSAVGQVMVSVSGRYVWFLSSTNNDGTQLTVNGGGRLLQFVGSVAVP